MLLNAFDVIHVMHTNKQMRINFESSIDENAGKSKI